MKKQTPVEKIEMLKVFMRSIGIKNATITYKDERDNGTIIFKIEGQIN